MLLFNLFLLGNGDGSPVVEEYGSFVMDMFDGKSDIDLSLNFNNSIEVSRQKKISALYRFNKKLQSIQSKFLFTINQFFVLLLIFLSVGYWSFLLKFI